MPNPIKTFLDTRAGRINGETKHRMTVEMQGADAGCIRHSGSDHKLAKLKSAGGFCVRFEIFDE